MRHTMRTRTAVTGAAVVLSLTVLGGGIAQARSGQNAGVPADQTSSQTTEPADTTEPAGPDTDTLQQGDQGTPDQKGAGAASARPAVVNVTPAGSRTTQPATAANTSETTGENAGESGGETDGENEGVNDGPGGHQDPPGDVQNEGGPNEH